MWNPDILWFVIALISIATLGHSSFTFLENRIHRAEKVISVIHKELFTLTFFIPLVLALACASKPAGETSSLQRVMDHANLLTVEQEDSIAFVSQGLEEEIGSQLAVLIIDSLGGERIEDFSLRKANEYRLGRSTHNDGILITVSVQDRIVRIEVGTGLERIIHDDLASHLIREDIAPKFRQERFSEGLYIVSEKISNLIKENKEQIGQ